MRIISLSTLNKMAYIKERREPSGDVVMYEGGVEYHCESNQEAEDLSDSLNDAPKSATNSWDEFVAWAKRVNHPIIKMYNYA